MPTLRCNWLPKLTSRGTMLLLASVATVASAAISDGVDDPNGIGDPEFALVIWDPANEASYTLDLGLRAETLLVDGRSDAGYQQFWVLDRTQDSNLASLLNLGANLSDLQWGVFAVEREGFPGLEGDYRLFSTLQRLEADGILSANYTQFLSIDNGSFQGVINAFATSLVSNLNSINDDPTNGHQFVDGGSAADYAVNGSSFTVIGQPGYFADTSAVLQSFGLDPGPSSTNAIGRSSWAYFATEQGFFDTTQVVLVDEFDNLEHDAYWGLVDDPATGILYLSFTLDAVGTTTAQREFAQSIGRTEFDSGFAVRRLEGVAAAAGIETPNGFSRALGAADTALITSAVPEPGTYALMTLGLLAVGAAAARRR